MIKLFSDKQIEEKDIDTLKRFLRYKLGGYRVAIKDVRTENRLYRGVRWPDRPQKISELSYPPARIITRLGRANRIGQPMFYSSPGAPAVFYELRARAGEFIALSEWELTEPLWMHNLGFHPDALNKIGTPVAAARPQFANPVPDEARKNERLRRKLSLAFTEDAKPGEEHRYKQSIAINELLFDKAEPFRKYPGGPNIDRAAGTVYPTVQMRGSADNVAIWPEFADRALRVKSVKYVQVQTADEAMSAYTFLTVSSARTFAGENIVWDEVLPPENERRSYIGFEDGAWILRDGFGRIYDRH